MFPENEHRNMPKESCQGPVTSIHTFFLPSLWPVRPSFSLEFPSVLCLGYLPWSSQDIVSFWLFNSIYPKCIDHLDIRRESQTQGKRRGHIWFWEVWQTAEMRVARHTATGLEAHPGGWQGYLGLSGAGESRSHTVQAFPFENLV